MQVLRRKTTDKSLIFAKLPINMYPEYHKVAAMLQSGGNGYQGYKVFEEHVVTEILPDRRVKLVGPNSCSILKVYFFSKYINFFHRVLFSFIIIF